MKLYYHGHDKARALIIWIKVAVTESEVHLWGESTKALMHEAAPYRLKRPDLRSRAGWVAKLLPCKVVTASEGPREALRRKVRRYLWKLIQKRTFSCVLGEVKKKVHDTGRPSAIKLSVHHKYLKSEGVGDSHHFSTYSYKNTWLLENDFDG